MKNRRILSIRWCGGRVVAFRIIVSAPIPGRGLGLWLDNNNLFLLPNIKEIAKREEEMSV